jgi:hypothetical protein
MFRQIMGRRGRAAAASAACAATLGTIGATAPAARAATPQNGAAATTWASGFAFEAEKRRGPIGVVFDDRQRLYVSALDHVFRFGPGGGDASSARLSSSPVGRIVTGMAFGLDGRLYAARYTDGLSGDVVELDRTSATVRRVVAAGLPCPTGLATDPLSGDLFVSTVGCTEQVGRIAKPASASPTTSTWISGLSVDGITFAPDGRMYLAHEPDGSGATVSEVSPTDAGPVRRRALATVPNADGVALGRPSQPGAALPFLVVNRTDGRITKVDLRDDARPQTDIVTGGTRGDLIAVGDDGCLYATQTDAILRITNADGGCRAKPDPATGGPGASAALEGGLLTTSVRVRATLATGGLARCSRTRRLRVAIRFGGARMQHVRVYVAGRRVRTVRGRALRRPVRIASLPNRTFTVTVRARTRGGRSLVRRTTYSACGRKVLRRRTARR